MIDILFIDDNPQELARLRHSLRAFRSEWTMQFCESPQEAISVLQHQHFDAVVSDINLRVQDGVSFLDYVRELYPDTFRIILGSLSEQPHLLGAVTSAHGILSKPCNPDFLHTTVTRCCLRDQRIDNPKLTTLVSQLESLPSLPDIYYELVDVLQGPNASVDLVGELISQDIGMTTKVLQLVNSSYFGLPVQVFDARHAAALLGLNTLKPLVLTASIFRQLEESKVSPKFLEKVTCHSYAVAGMAKKLAQTENAGREEADQAFLAGALHDIGKIVLADNLGQEYTNLIQTANSNQQTLVSVELEHLGTTHADVGGYLLQLWGLPAEICTAVLFHHDPQFCDEQAFQALAAVYVANAFANDQEVSQEYLTFLDKQDRLDAWRRAVDTDAVTA